MAADLLEKMMLQAARRNSLRAPRRRSSWSKRAWFILYAGSNDAPQRAIWVQIMSANSIGAQVSAHGYCFQATPLSEQTLS
jgi:hypothetical protein